MTPSRLDDTDAILVNELHFVDATVDAILKAARHGEDGKVGDGKIFITPLEEAVRIRTEEKGEEAV